jgi:hypothetical protein
MVGTMVHFKNPLLCLIRDRILYKRTPKRTWRKRARAYLEAGKAAS